MQFLIQCWISLSHFKENEWQLKRSDVLKSIINTFNFVHYKPLEFYNTAIMTFLSGNPVESNWLNRQFSDKNLWKVICEHSFYAVFILFIILWCKFDGNSCCLVELGFVVRMLISSLNVPLLFAADFSQLEKKRLLHIGCTFNFSRLEKLGN